MDNFSRKYNQLSSFFASLSTRRYIISIILIQFLLHLPIFHLPPMGQHVWRQVMGLSVARNYYQEERAFMLPAQDIRIGEQDGGEVYTEFPLIYWLLGKSYHLTGFSHLNGRMMAFFFSVILLLGCYKLMRELHFDEYSSRWFVFFMSFTPYFFYYSVSLLPNLPSLAVFIWGVVLMKSQLEKEKWGLSYFLGILLLTLSTITKQLYLFYGLSVSYLFIRQYLRSKKYSILIWGVASGAFLLVVNYILYRYGLAMNEIAAFERSSTVQLHDEHFPAEWGEFIRIFENALTTWFLEMYVNTAAIPLFLAGCFFGIKNKKWKSKYSGFWIFWGVGFILLSYSFFMKFDQHGYYLTSISVLAALGSTYGAINLKEYNFGKKLLVFLLVFIPFVMVGRVHHRWVDTKQVPDELLYSSETFQAFIPEDQQVIVHGDATPVVYLYFLNRKGISVDLNALPESKLMEYKNKGFEFIVSQQDPKSVYSLTEGDYHVLAKIGDFYVIKF